MGGWLTSAAVAFLAGALVAPGSLDPSWGGDGTVVTAVGRTSGTAVAVLPDARVVVAGSDSALGAVLVRYRPNGRLDRTFSGDGITAHRFGDAASAYRDVVVTGDGSVVAAGGITRRDVPGTQIVVSRHRPDGSLDPAFGGGDGWVAVDWASIGSSTGLAVHGDGRIVVTASGSSVSQVAIGLTPEGVLDPSFGNGGRTALALDSADDVAALGDGRSVVVGESGGRAVVTALRPDGTVDEAFGDAGEVGMNPTGWGAEFSAVAVAGDRIVATGTARLASGGHEDILVARLADDGRLDPSFGGDGTVTDPLGSGFHDRAVDVGVQGDGRVVVTATDDAPSGESVAMLRFRPDGRLDRSFGGTGVVHVDIGSRRASAADVGDGKAVLVALTIPIVTARVLL